MSNYLNYNGKFVRSDKPLITADNRGLRYGDGLFETMKMVNGKIELADYHFERLFEGIKIMQFEKPQWINAGYFIDLINHLAHKNQHEKLGRIRLMIFRGAGGLYDPENHIPHFIIQTSALDISSQDFNKNGLAIDIYRDARKSIDKFSSLKSNNYMPYMMAALYAKDNQLNDCLLLNSKEEICDSTIANVFIKIEKRIITPPLTSGCVAGVMRRYIIEDLILPGFNIVEAPISINDLDTAEEMFLSNSLYRIHWVEKCGSARYGNSVSTQIYDSIVKELSSIND